MKRLKLITYILICAFFHKGFGQTAEEQTWQPEINFTKGQFFKYDVTDKNTVTGNLSPNRDTENRYSLHFNVLEKKTTYCILSVEYLFNDTTVNTLFDFIHKIVRPSLTIRLDMEQAVIDIENDSEIVEYISQYVEHQNKLIEESTYQESLKRAIQSPNKEEILYGQLFSDIYRIFGHLMFGNISIKDTLEYTKPVYSSLINQEAVGQAIFFVRDFIPENHISFVEEVEVLNYGDLLLEHSRKVLEGVKTKKPPENFPKPDITYTAITEGKIDLMSSLAISTSRKVTINSKEKNGTINNEMQITYILVEE